MSQNEARAEPESPWSTGPGRMRPPLSLKNPLLVLQTPSPSPTRLPPPEILLQPPRSRCGYLCSAPTPSSPASLHCKVKPGADVSDWLNLDTHRKCLASRYLTFAAGTKELYLPPTKRHKGNIPKHRGKVYPLNSSKTTNVPS